MSMVCVLGCFQVGRLFVHVRLLAALPVMLRHSGNVLLFCLFVSIFGLSRVHCLVIARKTRSEKMSCLVRFVWLLPLQWP